MLVGAVGAGMAAAAVVARLQARRQPRPSGAGAGAAEDTADALHSAGAGPIPSAGEPPAGEPGEGGPDGPGPAGLAGWSAAVSEAVPAPPPPPSPTGDRVSFADIPPATRPPERTEAAADTDRPPLPSRTPQAQAPIPAEEPIPYEPPVFDVADIAPLADMARASWGSQAVPDGPTPPPPARAGSMTTEATAARTAPAGSTATEAPAPAAPAEGTVTEAPAPPPPVATPAGPGANGRSATTTGPSPAPAAASPTGAGPDRPDGSAVGSPGGSDGRKRWLIAGGAVAAVAAVAVGVGVLAGGGDDDPVATTATTDRPSATSGTTATTAPPSPEQAFRQAGTKLTEAGSFSYAGSARALDVTPVRPTRWLGTELTVTGEVDLRAGRLHEVAVAPDGEATETVIDAATVWGRQADSVDELADAEYSVIDELTRDEPTPQGAQLVPVWLALAAGPVPAPEAAAQPAYSGTLTAAALGDESGATPDSVITLTLDAGGTPIHLEVVGQPDGDGLRLVYDLANVGQVGPIASPGDAEAPAGGSTDTTAPATSSTSVADTTPDSVASTTTSTTERRRGGPGTGPGSTEPSPD